MDNLNVGDKCWIKKSIYNNKAPEYLFGSVVVVVKKYPSSCIVNDMYGIEWNIPHNHLKLVE